jgi:hypothetical protein
MTVYARNIRRKCLAPPLYADLATWCGSLSTALKSTAVVRPGRRSALPLWRRAEARLQSPAREAALGQLPARLSKASELVDPLELLEDMVNI